MVESGLTVASCPVCDCEVRVEAGRSARELRTEVTLCLAERGHCFRGTDAREAMPPPSGEVTAVQHEVWDHIVL